MTDDDIISMAREAGFIVDEQSQEMQPNCIFHTWHMVDEGLARFAALVAAAEREACATICDEIANKPSNVVLGVAVDCAAAIRARGEK
jgi:uncharacterized protein YfcZ (UPF0381/DUF406 family)